MMICQSRRVGLLRCAVVWLSLCLVLCVGCSKQSKGPCNENDDCIFGELCKDGTCIPKQCDATADCQANSLCDNGLCVAVGPKACRSSNDCAQGETCDGGECKARGCTDTSCPNGEVCIQGQVCDKKTVPCSNNQDCKASELCVGPSPNKKVCTTWCFTNRTKPDKTNETCWGAWGWCVQSKEDPTIGICAPPRQKNRKKGETCQDLRDLNKPDHNDCEAGLTCILGECNGGCDAQKGSSTNPDCPEGSYCQNGTCLLLPQPQSGGFVKEGESCSSSNTNSALFCGTNLFCYLGTCRTPCNPRQGKENSPDCKANEECLEEVNSYKGGRCAPKPTQKDSEPCDAGKLCLDGLRCDSGRCVQTCSSQDTTCDGQKKCYTLLRLCVTPCDPAEGASANKACNSGFMCVANTTVKPGYCRSLPGFSEGPKKLDETCSSSTAQRCDGNNLLYCRSGRCAKACDPRKGTDSNPNCDAKEECVDGETTSPLGGVCLTKATQKEGDPCNTTNMRCLTNLVCSRGRCQRTCTYNSSKPEGNCQTQEWCLRQGSGGACFVQCDPANGTAENKTCAKGYSCLAQTTTYKPGYCNPLPVAPTGKKKATEECSGRTSEEACDGSQELTCYNQRCVKACDPKDGVETNAGCSSGENCIVDLNSHLGGVCLSAPSQKENEECDSFKRCLKDLVCRTFGAKSYCQKTCDPSKQDACGPGFTCEKIRTDEGYCLADRAKTRKLNEVCKGAPGTDAANDCEDKLTCVIYPGSDAYCLEVCTSGSSTCKSGYSCVSVGSGVRACLQTCTQDTDCTTYGTACRGRYCR